MSYGARSENRLLLKSSPESALHLGVNKRSNTAAKYQEDTMVLNMVLSRQRKRCLARGLGPLKERY
jgi:hypothetical protein